jgi:hypothetical protein
MYIFLLIEAAISCQWGIFEKAAKFFKEIDRRGSAASAAHADAAYLLTVNRNPRLNVRSTMSQRV